MRERALLTVISFYTTTEAMAMETAAKEKGFGGRLIPLPGEISAGCGMAWRCETSTPDEAETFLNGQRLRYAGIYQVML